MMGFSSGAWMRIKDLTFASQIKTDKRHLYDDDFPRESDSATVDIVLKIRNK